MTVEGILGFCGRLSAPWIILAIACSVIVKCVYYFDLNKRAFNHVPGSCMSIAGVENGAEDVELLPNGIAVFTSGLKLYPSDHLNSSVTGKMYMYNFSANTAWELTMKGAGFSSKSFNPHGLTSWTPKGGKSRIYVINHHPRGDKVDVFELDEEKHELKHLKSIKDSVHFHTMADLQAIGLDKFYVSNYHYFNNTHARKAELYLALKTGSLVFYNGTAASYVNRFTLTPNGIALDRSRRYIYVASTMGSRIDVYKIESYTNGSITHYDVIELKTNPDNVFCDPKTGEVWVACHPIKFRLFIYESYPKTHFSPSQVIRLKGRPTRKRWEPEEIYASDGASLSGSSVAIRYDESFLIGTLHDKLLKCQFTFPDLF